MSESIIEKIINQAEDIEEKDFDWILPELLVFYSRKISYLSYKIYGNSSSQEGNALAKAALNEFARKELTEALKCYLFKFEHFRNGRDLNIYLLTCLNRLSDRIFNELNSVKKYNALCCPACKFLGKKELLIQEGKLWRCKECSAQIELLQDDLKKIKEKNEILKIESKIKFLKYFALHSKKGYRCPECNGFIPESCNTTHGIVCPM
jgi:hypothetical protein